ncbi:MAG: hypothetical protein E6K81_09435 [Candidatus Eisenbacteria bacterium]|uniref:Alginate lyase domain-containing protein n=1 Tax=Eiseniibacteriota bacterium TaxID=2212470 RepID=A0A538U754_UNCEI|nr:MAG: hypothetical protein E6K81_09435 [Candidatus Eisenbacteria bacterium]
MHLLAICLALTAASPPADDRALYDRACQQVAAAFDSARGGFVARSHVPSDAAVELGLLRGRQAGSEAWRDQALATIAWSRCLRDTLTGGFVAGGGNDEPTDAHAQKSASVNARRLENLNDAWHLTEAAGYQRDAARVVDFFDRALLDGRGGFLAGQGTDLELVPDANGLAIHAWLGWAAATRDTMRRNFGFRSLDRVWQQCWMPDIGLVRRGMFGEVLAPPQLVDQVEVGRALVLAARLMDGRADQDHARMLGDLLVTRFQDPERGGFSARWEPTGKGTAKRSGRSSADNARAARFLCELTTLTGDTKYRDAARRAWGDLARELDKPSLDAADWALALEAALEPALPDRPQWPTAAERTTPPEWRPMNFKVAGN